MSNSFRPHESKHARPPCPSPTPGFTQTHIHRVSDAIQPSHPLLSPSPPAPNPSQHQNLLQGVKSSQEVAKVPEFQLQHHSLQRNPRTDLLQNMCSGMITQFSFSSVAQSCLTPCDPMNHSTPGFPVHHQLPEFMQTHIHRVGDAIQPSHPLSSPSLPAPNPSQHQGLYQ